MSRPAHQHRALQEALIAALHPANIHSFSHRAQPWASITFSGARHSWDMVLEGSGAREAAQRLAQDAATQEFDVPGQIVADISVQLGMDQPHGFCVQIEALTVDAR